MRPASETKPTLCELLRSRVKLRCKQSSSPTLDDGFHLALVIESGGNRAASAGGMVSALREIELLKCIDSVHGSSAGACTAAYFVSDQTELGYEIFVNRLTSRNVVDWSTLLAAPSIINGDYIVDTIFKNLAKLDVEQVINSRAKLAISLTNADSGRSEIHHSFERGEQIFEALRATLRIPSFGERGVLIGSARYLDGGISAPIPLHSAISFRATHVLILGTQRPRDYTPSFLSLRHLEAAYLCMTSNCNVAKAYATHNRAEIYEKITSRTDPTMDMITRHNDDANCSVFETDPEKVAQVWSDGRDAALRFIERSLIDNVL